MEACDLFPRGAAGGSAAAPRAPAAARRCGAAAATLLAPFAALPGVLDQFLFLLAKQALRLGHRLIGYAALRVCRALGPARRDLPAPALPRAAGRRRPAAGAAAASPDRRHVRKLHLGREAPDGSSAIRKRLPSRMNVTASSFLAHRGLDSTLAVFSD